MHILQSKNSKLKQEEVEKLLQEFNISLAQLPKISMKDAIFSEEVTVGDVIRFERKSKDGLEEYFRVVI